MLFAVAELLVIVGRALLLTAVLSLRRPVRPSVCHTRDPRLNGSRYRNAFALHDTESFSAAKFRGSEFRGSSRTSVLERYRPAVAAPGRQDSQVIFKVVRQVIRCKRQLSKESGHLRKSSSQVTGCTFSSKKLTTVFSCKRHAANAADCFTVKIKQIKRSDMVTFLFSAITEAKQQAGRSQGGGSSSQVIDLARPGEAGVAPLLSTPCRKRKKMTNNLQ